MKRVENAIENNDQDEVREGCVLRAMEKYL
jgi:hypothetical protein